MNKVGVDIVYISRVKDKLKERILSFDELTIYNSLSNIRKEEFLAGRFAIKEALFKAGIKKEFNKLSVLYNEDGSIYLKDYDNVSVSISHEKEYAIGFAIINL